MRVSDGRFAEVFWSADVWSTDVSFTPERSVRLPLHVGGTELQRLRFPFPPRDVRWLRFDPTDAAGEIVVGDIVVREPTGRAHRLPPDSLEPANQIASVDRQDGVTRFITTPGAGDPYLLLPVGCLTAASADRRERLSSFGVIALCLAVLVTCALGVGFAVAVALAAFGPQVPVGFSDGLVPSLRVALLWMAALFIVVFSSKLLLMRAFPMTVPLSDQWGGEGVGLYVPFSECWMTWRYMFALHNEHRVFFTRLLALALLMGNGQWDPRLQQVVNAAIRACTAVCLVVALWSANRHRRLDLLALVVGLSFAPPFAWENTVFPFQSAFYFVDVFSILALWLITGHDAGSWQWWLGVAAALSGMFAAAGGLLTPLAAAAVILMWLAREPRDWRPALASLSVLAVVSVIGVLTASAPIPNHAALKARSLWDFAGSLGHNLAWPWIEQRYAGIVMWFPFAAFVIARFRRPGGEAVERFTIGLGVWALLQSAALAYGRGAGAPLPANRYEDALSIGFVVNTIVLILWIQRTRVRTTGRRLAAVAVASWLIVSILGLDQRLRATISALSVNAQLWKLQATSVRQFEITGDFAKFVARPALELPYAAPVYLARLLQHPYIHRILPGSVRTPVRVDPRVVSDESFVRDGVHPTMPRDPLTPTWGSYSSRGNAGEGRLESLPISACRTSFLRFEVAGYLGLPGEYLAVRELRSGRETEVRPRLAPHEAWTPILVPCPTGPYVIIAADERPDYWFAFRDPVEIGRFSPTAETLIEYSIGMLCAGLALAALAVRLT